MASNWMELRLTQDEEEFVKRNAETYRAVHVETIDTIFGWAKSIEILQKRFYSSGVQGAFADALVQYGWTSRDGGPMAKSIRSNLKNLLDNEQSVRKWWADVPARAKRDWTSPRAIHRHWKAAQKPRDPDAPKTPTPLQREKATTQFLTEQLREANARLEADGDQFDLDKTGAETIGKIIVKTWRMQPSRIETLIRTLNAELKELRALTKAARPRKRSKKAEEVQA